MRFLLLDRIEEVVPGQSVRGWKNASMTEDYFEWHFPERPIVPGVLVLESFVQLAGWAEAASPNSPRKHRSRSSRLRSSARRTSTRP